MSVKMSKAKSVLFAVAIFLSSFPIMWQMYEVVIVNDLYIAFPEHEGIITGILSWPALVTAVGSLLAGVWLKKVSTKLELTIAGVLMLAGLVPRFSSNVYLLMTACILMAMAAGLSNTAGMSLLAEVYVDENMRNRMMGWYNAIMCLISCGITLIGGALAVNGWQVGFNVYWFTVPMLLLTIIGLPNIKPEDRIQEEVTAAEADSTQKGGFGLRFWMFFVVVFVWFMMYCPFFSLVSVYIAENELGDTAFIGIASTLTTIGSMVAGLIFGFLFARLKRVSNIIFFAIPILIYLVGFFIKTPAVALAGTFLYGVAYGGVFTFIYAYPAYVVPAEKMGFAMGLMTMNYSVAIFLGVYLITYLMGLCGGTVTGTFPICLAVVAICTIFEIVLTIADKKAKVFDIEV